MTRTAVTVTIDTEEDNWGSFAATGATVNNIAHLPELQEIFDRWGARPTYLVNRPPFLSSRSVEVLAALSARESVEIGGHCHPWNTPPDTGSGPDRSMMNALPSTANRGKVAEITRLIKQELGIRPVSFRAGRWGFGSTVAEALWAEGYRVDASVSPFVDWSAEGGPDYSSAPHQPYRFDPRRPLVPDCSGHMVELPTTVGYLSGDHRTRARIRRFLERSPARRLKVIGMLNRMGVLSRRWLSPEATSASEMIQLVAHCLRAGELVLDMTFHSCTLLPGATPFVRDGNDRARFLTAIDAILRFCSEAGLAFETLSEVAERMFGVETKPTERT